MSSNESTGITYVLYHEIKQQYGASMNWDAVNEALASDEASYEMV